MLMNKVVAIHVGVKWCSYHEFFIHNLHRIWVLILCIMHSSYYMSQLKLEDYI